MRSPMVESASYIPNKRSYSDLQVMQSAAGWYIGTTFNGEWGPEPGSRDSGYYATKAEAEADLAKLVADPTSVPLRTHP